MSFLDSAKDLLGVALSPSPTRLALLGNLESRLGITLPEAFREWYSYEQCVDLLMANSNCDHPLDIDRLGEALPGRESYDAFAHRLLPFMIENQGVCTWAIVLDQGQDPPVVVEVDSGTPPTWLPCANRFSTWLYCQVWDRQLQEGVWFQAEDVPLSDADLQSLRARFQEGHCTNCWPGNANYRFFGPEGSILIWNGDKEADWFISPKGSAENIVKFLWNCGSLSASLYGITADGKRLLKRLREEG